MNTGIKIHKSYTSKILVILKKNGILDEKYKINKIDEYVMVPVKHLDCLDKLIDVPYEAIQFDFTSKKIKKKSIKEILLEIIPRELHSFIPTAFDQIGEIAIIDIKNEILEFKEKIGSSILIFNKKISTVYRKSGKVDGVYRIRDLELIAGEDNPITIHKEHNIRFLIDVKRIYFSPRLAREHQRIASIVEKNELILDMFCALAPFAFHILKDKECHVTVIDINPASREYINKTFELNRKINKNIDILIGDAHLLNKQLISSGNKYHHIIMNHPSGAIDFLDDAIKLLDTNGTIHLYIFSPVEDYNAYCNVLLEDYPVVIINIHRVRQSSPSEYHLSIDLRHK